MNPLRPVDRTMKSGCLEVERWKNLEGANPGDPLGFAHDRRYRWVKPPVSQGGPCTSGVPVLLSSGNPVHKLFQVFSFRHAGQHLSSTARPQPEGQVDYTKGFFWASGTFIMETWPCFETSGESLGHSIFFALHRNGRFWRLIFALTPPNTLLLVAPFPSPTLSTTLNHRHVSLHCIIQITRFSVSSIEPLESYPRNRPNVSRLEEHPSKPCLLARTTAGLQSQY